MKPAENIFLGIIGLCAGIGVSGGVFTTLIAVGLIPRFAGKTHSAKHIFLYEEMVVWGTVLGGIISIFFPYLHMERLAFGIPGGEFLFPGIGYFLLALYGLFAGIFVGCLALAIAEMLDSIPIFARRIGFRHGIGIAIACMAVGKTLGSVFHLMQDYIIKF